MTEEQCAACLIADYEICEECCDHSDCDDHCCLDCGKEMMEDWACRAYDQVKAARQDRDI